MAVKFLTATRAALATRTLPSGTIVFLNDPGNPGLAIGDDSLGGKILGLSAYDIAVNNGFEGTEQEWLDSLEGDKGDQGDPGPGLPAGGSIYKVPVKNSSTDYDVSWHYAILTSNANIYVSTTGSDDNDGLTAETPFRTIQKAIDLVGRLYIRNNSLQINIADGIYNEAIVLRFITGGMCKIVGNTTNPENVIINSGSVITINSSQSVSGGYWKISGVTITGASSTNIVVVGPTLELTDCIIETQSNAQAIQAYYSDVLVTNTKFSGSCLRAFFIAYNSTLQTGGTITLLNTPNFTTCFVLVQNAAHARFTGVSFVGSATGKRYQVDHNSVIRTDGSGDTFLPGNVAGTTSAGGQYI